MSRVALGRSWVCTSLVQTLEKSHRALLWASSKLIRPQSSDHSQEPFQPTNTVFIFLWSSVDLTVDLKVFFFNETKYEDTVIPCRMSVKAT